MKLKKEVPKGFSDFGVWVGSRPTSVKFGLIFKSFLDFAMKRTRSIHEVFIFKQGKQKIKEPLTHRSVVVPCKAECQEKNQTGF